MVNARLRLSVVTFLVVTATFVNGASTGGVLTGLLLNKLHEFRASSYGKRQAGSNGSGISLDDFPQQCQAGCQVAVDTMNTCTLPSCLCTPAVESSLQDCINCSVKLVPDPTIIQDGEQVFNTFNALCSNTGIKTLSLTAVTVSSTNIATANTSSFINPFLPSSTPITTPTMTTTAPPPLGPTTTITPTVISSLAPNTLNGNPSTSVISNPLTGNDAVALPRASKAYAAVGLVVAFFMCLA